MDCMQPGNSFPQICVVSVNTVSKLYNFAQEYERSVDQSTPFLFT